jgi:hypothetical protein
VRATLLGMGVDPDSITLECDARHLCAVRDARERSTRCGMGGRSAQPRQRRVGARVSAQYESARWTELKESKQYLGSGRNVASTAPGLARGPATPGATVTPSTLAGRLVASGGL